mgnify:CR=1 FL=1
MEKFKRISEKIEDMKVLIDRDEATNYAIELTSELELILKEREEMIGFIKKYYKFLNLDDQVEAEKLIKKIE